MASSDIGIEELETHSLEIINELNVDRVATFESVVSILLERYEVCDFSELHRSGVFGIPMLQRLHRLNLYTNTFLDMYLFAQKENNCILSLKECESSLCDMLSNLSIQSSYIFAEYGIQNKENKSDLSEVVIDNDDENSKEKCVPGASFQAYGIGKIQNHFKIKMYFPPALLQSFDISENILKLEQVYADKRDFRLSKNTKKSFETYLLDKYNVDSISKLGIVLPFGEMELESLIQRNVSLLQNRKLDSAKNQSSELSTALQIANARQSSFTAEHVFRHPIEAYLSSSEEKEQKIITIDNKFLTNLCFPLDNRSSNHEKEKQNIKNIGKWGEALVYQYLLQQYEGNKITWINEKEESMSCYDILLEIDLMDSSEKEKKRKTTQTIFIEVKSTRFPNLNVFDISQNEWEFCSKLPAIRYDIYRVYNAGNPGTVFIQVLQDVHSLINEKRLRLCLAV